MYVVTVEFSVKRDYGEKFIDLVKNQARNSLEREKECQQFDVCLDPKNMERIFLYEIYTDEPAFQAHLKSEHFSSFDKQAKEWVVSKKVQIWEKVIS